MDRKLLILNLEDNSNDTELIQAKLEDEGFECRLLRVETEAEFISALDRNCFDLLLVDYKLPAFDGMSALAIAGQKCPDVPFIFVSGSIGEDIAIEALKNGATDYVLKQRLARLGPAVIRALKEKEEREALRAANEALRASEELLRQAQKMEAIGTLAGGIAHDFNNILNVIMGYGGMVAAKVSADPSLSENMREILAAAERAANLTRRLLVFSRKQLMDLKPSDLNEIVRNFEKMLSRILGEDISFKSDLMDRKLMVMADTGHIEQVLMNLASNARDAMPKGGSLTIRVCSGEIDGLEKEVYSGIKPGNYAVLQISDTGTGMDEEVQKHIFEPFYTTKRPGEGTGLGLAISYGIVEKHNGFMKVSSTPGKGTTFTVLLPLIEESSMAEMEGTAAVSLSGGSETVLVAEDDASLRKLLSITLEAFGYTVITAEDGEGAIVRFREHQDSIKLLILDLIMPHKGGREAFEEIRRMNPGIGVLFSSGYPADVLKSHEFLSSGYSYIPKPISPRDLLTKVREMLDKDKPKISS